MKRSVALVIRDTAHPGMVLLVQRPADDEDLPGVWGLPAATLREAETPRAAARRAGRDKLGVELEIGGVLNAGGRDRGPYRLEMQLMAARIRSGALHTGREATDGTTRYQAWRWGRVAELTAAADRGSLCSRLALEARLEE